MDVIRSRVTLFVVPALIVALGALGVAAMLRIDDASYWFVQMAAALCAVVAVVGVAEIRALRTAKESLSTAFDNISHGLCMFDAAGRLVLFNTRYLEMYKLSPDVVKS